MGRTGRLGLTRTRPRGSGGRAAGFSLVEVLVVVAIVGIVTSAAIPVVARALVRSRVTAAGAALRDLHLEMIEWSKENNRFPLKREFQVKTLNPLVKDGVITKTESRSILRHFPEHRIYYYWEPGAGQDYQIYTPVRGTSYWLWLRAGTIMKYDAAGGGYAWTPIDQWKGRS